MQSVATLADACIPADARPPFEAASQSVVAVASEQGPLTFAMKSAFETRVYAFVEHARGVLHNK